MGEYINMEYIYTIVLNYNNYDDTYECIESLRKIIFSSDFVNKIILIDNYSTDDSFEKLKNIYDDIVFIQTDKNLGYACGNNLGIKYAISEEADYICILNNDTLVEDNFIEPCIAALKKTKNLAFVGPVIEEYKSDRIQSSGGDIMFNRGLIKIKNNGLKRKDLEYVIDCDYIGGACMVFKASLIEEIGLIPENYYLFFEETEWCYRAKKKGLKNQCITNTYIKHKGSASIDMIEGLHPYLMERNRVVFLMRNAPSVLVLLEALIYLGVKYIKWGILRDKRYFKYLLYMKDGLFNEVNYKKYPFIVIRK